MKTVTIDGNVDAVWLVKSEVCELLVSMRTGQQIGRIDKNGRKWNTFWAKTLARRAVECEAEMKGLLDQPVVHYDTTTRKPDPA